jgi:DNA topoisomerase-1
LPDLSEGTRLTLEELVPKQHFTQPPPRFSEASLVKELEENGIGRPSTYASILTTIRQKGYVEMRRGYFCPSELGLIVNDLLVQNFPRVFDVEFTAKMEDTLDRIESAELDATEILSRFYTNFKKSLDAASDGMLSVKGVGIPTDLPCPECSRTLHIKVGKNGHFLACSGYPECTYSRDYTRDEKGRVHPVEIAEEEVSDKTCPECESPMVVKQGRYGKFLACSRYPDCKSTQSLNANGSEVDTGVACPEAGCDGRIVERTSRRGKVFYGCNRFPKCKFAIWDKPVAEACPQCAAPFLVQKTTKKTGPMLKCRQPECGYQRELDGAT